MLIIDEVRANLDRNRTPMLFWSCVAVAPLVVAAVAFGWWMNFGRAAGPDSITKVDVPLSDRAWSIYQSIDCVEASCDDVKDAKQFLLSSADTRLEVATPTGSGFFQLTSLSDDGWSKFADMATQGGRIKLSEVTDSATSAGTLVNFQSAGLHGQMDFDSEDNPALTTIRITS